MLKSERLLIKHLKLIRYLLLSWNCVVLFPLNKCTCCIMKYVGILNETIRGFSKSLQNDNKVESVATKTRTKCQQFVR